MTRRRREQDEGPEPTPRLMSQARVAVRELRVATAELHGILEEVRREVPPPAPGESSHDNGRG